MNIFYCITFFHYGAGRALLDLAKEAVRRGHNAVIAATDNIEPYASQTSLIEEAEHAGIMVILCDDLFTRQFNRVSGSASRIRSLMETEQFDLIHSHAAVPGFAAELAAQDALKRRLPHISTVHAWGPDKPNWMKLQDRLVLNQVECVHAVSDDVGRFLVSEGVQPAKIVRIYNGCDFQRIDRLVTEGGQHPVAGGRRHLGTVANLVDRKGINYLVEAVALLPQQLRDEIEVLVVGDGPDRAALEDQAAQLEITSTVKFAGAQSNPFPSIASFEFFVLPSLSEGLPVSLVEAMYLKVPVLATDVQGNREIAQDGRGHLVSARDPQALAQAMTDMLQDPATSRQKAEDAYQWVTTQFDRSACFNQVFAIYEKVCHSM